MKKTLRELRAESNISQVQLAEQLGVSRARVSQWETGRADISASHLESLSKIFGVPKEDIQVYEVVLPFQKKIVENILKVDVDTKREKEKEPDEAEGEKREDVTRLKIVEEFERYCHIVESIRGSLPLDLLEKLIDLSQHLIDKLEPAIIVLNTEQLGENNSSMSKEELLKRYTQFLERKTAK